MTHQTFRFHINHSDETEVDHDSYTVALTVDSKKPDGCSGKFEQHMMDSLGVWFAGACISPIIMPIDYDWWIPVGEAMPIPVSGVDFSWPTAKVLAKDKFGRVLIANLEQPDPEEPPVWYTDCSEHWRLDDDVITCWRVLPL